MFRNLAIALGLAVIPASANAQAVCPQITAGEVWTTAQWNACFASLSTLAAAANGSLTSPTITGGSINGATVNPSGGIGQIVSIITASGAVVPGVALNETVIVNQASPAAVSVVLPAASNWPACPSASSAACPVYVIKDGAGNAATYPITVTAADSKKFDGAASDVISANYGAEAFILNGTQWNVIP